MHSEGYGTWSISFVCLYVCLLPRFLQPRATTQRYSAEPFGIALSLQKVTKKEL